MATPPGEQAGCTRYSVAYFLRSENNASIRRLESDGVIPQPVDGEEGEDMRVQDWQRKKVKSKYSKLNA